MNSQLTLKILLRPLFHRGKLSVEIRGAKIVFFFFFSRPLLEETPIDGIGKDGIEAPEITTTKREAGSIIEDRAIDRVGIGQWRESCWCR